MENNGFACVFFSHADIVGTAHDAECLINERDDCKIKEKRKKDNISLVDGESFLLVGCVFVV